MTGQDEPAGRAGGGADAAAPSAPVRRWFEPPADQTPVAASAPRPAGDRAETPVPDEMDSGSSGTGAPADLDWQAELLLQEIGRSGQWSVWTWGRHAADLVGLGLSRQVADYADVVILRSPAAAAAWRMVRQPGVSIWLPQRVVWHYVGSAVHVLRAVLRIMPPDWMVLPWYPAPAECRAPEERIRPARFWPRRRG